jgi:two-component system, cell cycle sensor histidine kinase and response regulator CckA
MTDSGGVATAISELDSALTPSSISLAPRYQKLFESALLGIYVSRPDGRLIACNGAFARMLGFDSVDEAVGTGMRDIYSDPAERDRFLARVREQGRLEHYRGRMRRRNGVAIDVIETVVGEFADGELVELCGFLIDVTANVEAEAALEERARQFRAVFLDAADAMLILDDKRTILEANPAACALFGIGSESIADRSLDGLLVEAGDQLITAWRELLALGEAKREHRVASSRDVTRLVECSYRARVHGDRHLCIARDITDRRLLEERLMQSEKIESVGRLAGGIAHDFNNLLTAILGYTELLISHRGDADPDRADLEEIQKAGQRAASLTQQLLAFSRKQVLMPKDVDLNQTVAGLKSMLTRLIREDITLSCELADRPATVKVDPTQIEQAILNLVLNARDALPAGGHIRLEVACVRRSQVEVPPELQSMASDYVRLRVIDDGVGISAEAREHLFEPFFTTKDIGKGTGLGLASVYGIVRQSNGFIAVESQPGSGTAFTIHFPAVAKADDVQPPAVAIGGPSRGRETILLVEDEDAVRVIVSAVLRRQGYNVLEASTPRGAWEIFERHAGEIDLLLSDVVMPEMNGPALAQRLVTVRPELRILFISGYADMTTPPESDNPNVSFLSKPFQASVLGERVRQMLARPGRTRSAP